MAHRPEPTEDELRRAWQHLHGRRRSPWPATFEEAMADALLSRLVRITAMHPPRMVAIPPRRRLRQPTARSESARGIDRKRAAAGDRDD